MAKKNQNAASDEPVTAPVADVTDATGSLPGLEIEGSGESGIGNRESGAEGADSPPTAAAAPAGAVDAQKQETVDLETVNIEVLTVAEVQEKVNAAVAETAAKLNIEHDETVRGLEKIIRELTARAEAAGREAEVATAKLAAAGVHHEAVKSQCIQASDAFITRCDRAVLLMGRVPADRMAEAASLADELMDIGDVEKDEHNAAVEYRVANAAAQNFAQTLEQIANNARNAMLDAGQRKRTALDVITRILSTLEKMALQGDAELASAKARADSDAAAEAVHAGG